ncbi:beta-1,4-galactosyltransferase 6-like [Diadema antillarum]|uniref:beta-1,4-galactosyltransferase 6-like n=1 Tax=Diadema antillarum TaxID=105358 RepID=UPI003A857194
MQLIFGGRGPRRGKSGEKLRQSGDDRGRNTTSNQTSTPSATKSGNSSSPDTPTVSEVTGNHAGNISTKPNQVSHPKEKCQKSSSLPHNEAVIQPRKEPISLSKVRAELLGSLSDRVQKSVAIANEQLPTILTKRRTMTEEAQTIDGLLTDLQLSLDVREGYKYLPGGHWIPTSCQARWKVAIIIPFRDRFQHLPIFLRHIVPLLQRQQLEFSIFVTEQNNNLRFNRAMLMNVGFVEALNFTAYDCVIFHDVDHIALNANNYLGCDDMPRHFISGEAMWGYKILYEALFGGVTGLTTKQMRAINGLPNVYWGWGGEDDEFAQRVKSHNFHRTRPTGEIGYFDTINHRSVSGTNANVARFCLLKHQHERATSDGLSNLAYQPPVITLNPLYTNISVNIPRLPWNNRWTRCPGS